jgi:hypothetical protein
MLEIQMSIGQLLTEGSEHPIDSIQHSSGTFCAFRLLRARWCWRALVLIRVLRGLATAGAHIGRQAALVVSVADDRGGWPVAIPPAVISPRPAPSAGLSRTEARSAWTVGETESREALPARPPPGPVSAGTAMETSSARRTGYTKSRNRGRARRTREARTEEASPIAAWRPA